MVRGAEVPTLRMRRARGSLQGVQDDFFHLGGDLRVAFAGRHWIADQPSIHDHVRVAPFKGRRSR